MSEESTGSTVQLNGPTNPIDQSMTSSANRYKLLKRIGVGGFGEVWLAFDERLGRNVAIKKMKNGRLSLRDRRDLKKEAQISAGLVHKNIIQVYDFFGTDHPHIVQEYVEGKTLHKELSDLAIQGSWLEADEAADIFLQMLEGLRYAHSQQVVHRDIKPLNIMLTKDGTVKIGDFGLARHLISRADGRPPYLKTNLGGTIPFMSPEQARGETLDFRTDIFSAGIVGYILFTRRHPFAHPSTIPEIVNLIRDETFEAPSFSFESKILSNAEFTVLRMLSKNLEDRFRSLDDVLESFSSSIGRTCSVCHSTSPLDSRFCSNCGQMLKVLSKPTHDSLPTEIPEDSRGIEDSPSNTTSIVERGLQCLQTEPRDWDGAISLFRRAVEVDPSNIRALRHLAVTLCRRRNYRAAISRASEGLKLATDPNDRCALLDARGLARSHLKDYLNAIGDFSDALKLDPNDPKLWSHRAESLAQIGRFNEAYSDVCQALELAPHLFVAQKLRSRLEAIADLSK